MWISKKKFNQMMAEAMERERDREMYYRFVEETRQRLKTLEDVVEELEHIVRSKHVRKVQLNG